MKAIILDDEIHCIKSLTMMCSKYTDVEVVQTFSDPIKALKEINSIEADILFLDIEMPFVNGFEFLQIFDDYPWKVVFTTAYDQYAVRAFKAHAISYLLKPIAKADLLDAIQQCQIITESQNKERIDTSVSTFEGRIRKVVIPSLSGLELLSPDDILYLKSDSNYTIFILKDGSEILVSKTLKSFENQLFRLGFLRVHHSYVVNINLIRRYVKGDGGYIVMENDHTINVSRARKEALLNSLKNIR